MDNIQFDRLRKSIAENDECRSWNEWRFNSPDIKINLRCADLSNLNLTKVNFSCANLRGADLSRSIMSCANLSKAILYETDMAQAILQSANLRDATFDETYLYETDFTKADLSGVRFVLVDLSNCQISQQQLDSAIGDVENVSLPRNCVYPKHWL